MQPINLLRQWHTNKNALLFGLGAGGLWGFLTAAGATPPEWLVYDETAGLVYKYLDGGILSATVPATYFFAEFNSTLIQLTLTFLALIGPAGWATWQLTRIRPRGEDQPALQPGLDWHLVGLAMGGLIFVWLFRLLGLAVWFKGAPLTPARVASIILGILLPLYMGISLFLVWFLRLKSIRAPDWDTHYPKPARKSKDILRFKLFQRRKGGGSSNN